MLRPTSMSSPAPLRASVPLESLMPKLTLRNSERTRPRPAWLPVALIHIFFAGVALGQDEPVSVETIERAKAAAVPIVCGAATESGSFRVAKIMGSAFFINEQGGFMTAAHVLDGWDKIDRRQGDCAPAIYMAIGGWKNDVPTPKVRAFFFSQCNRDDTIDIAVCKPIANPFTDEVVRQQVRFLTFGAFSGQRDGTAAAFTGFPLEFLRPVTSKGSIASYVAADKELVIDKAAWPGASGSPVYLPDGTVIGVVRQAGRGLGSGLAYARPAELIVEFLSKNKIPFHQQQPAQTPQQTNAQPAPAPKPTKPRPKPRPRRP